MGDVIEEREIHDFEPMVIIKDDSADGFSFPDNDAEQEDPLNIVTEYPENEITIQSITVGSEVTIIPVKKRPQIKIKLLGKTQTKPYNLKTHYITKTVNGRSASGQQVPVVIVKSNKQGSGAGVPNRSPRQPVRLISEDEAKQINDTYPHRKSLPLEKCPICMKFFRRMKTHLMKHDMATRDANDPLTCKLCRKAFNSTGNLQIHMRTHTGDRPYVCEVCQKGFAQSCNLVNHLRIHTGEKPFQCPYCDRAFTQSGNLNNHIRLHTDEKPFKCHFCGKAFVQSGNLNSHIQNNHKFTIKYEASLADPLEDQEQEQDQEQDQERNQEQE